MLTNAQVADNSVVAAKLALGQEPTDAEYRVDHAITILKALHPTLTWEVSTDKDGVPCITCTQLALDRVGASEFLGVGLQRR